MRPCDPLTWMLSIAFLWSAMMPVTLAVALDTADASGQFTDGRIVLAARDARVEGGPAKLEPLRAAAGGSRLSAECRPPGREHLLHEESR